MTIKIFVLSLCLLAFGSIGFAQSKIQADYIGDWSNGRAFQMFVDTTTIKFDSKGNKTQTYKYRDVTPSGSDVYFLEITSPAKESYFSKFITLTMAADINEMTITNYDLLADMKNGTNPQGNDTWFRDGVVFEDESFPISGTLQVGKAESVILYFGEESGDYAAYCFMNNSEAGKKILAACKNGEKCEFVGEIDGESPCKVPGLEADLSSSGKIISVESVKSLAVKSNPVKNTKVSTAANTPDAVIKNLYAAQKADKGPFFQAKSRKLVDQYFAKDLADMIWKDSVDAKGEVGAIDFDPLYNAQDSEITNFVIEKPRDDGGPDNAFVKVTFKNFGKAESVDYELQREAGKDWKITGIYYNNGEDLASYLRYWQDEEFKKEYEANQTFAGEYMVGKAKCTVTPTLNGMNYRVECESEEGLNCMWLKELKPKPHTFS